MKIPLDRIISFFATFFIPTLPLLAGIATKASHNVMVEAIAQNASSVNNPAPQVPIPLLAQLVFNHFHAILWGLYALALVLAILGYRQLRIKDPVERTGRQLLLALVGATLGGGFLAIYIVAAAHALGTPATSF